MPAVHFHVPSRWSCPGPTRGIGRVVALWVSEGGIGDGQHGGHRFLRSSVRVVGSIHSGHDDRGRCLTDTQFAHDGVSDHADVAFHVMRVLAS